MGGDWRNSTQGSVLFTLIVVFPTNKQLLDPALDSRSPRTTSRSSSPTLRF
jgi:hypothetical protein